MFDVILYVIHVSIRGYHRISCITKWVQWPLNNLQEQVLLAVVNSQYTCAYGLTFKGETTTLHSVVHMQNVENERYKQTRGMIPECTISPPLVSLHLASPYWRDYSVEVDRKVPMNRLSSIPRISGLQSSVEWNLKDKPVPCYIDLLSSWSRRLSN